MVKVWPGLERWPKVYHFFHYLNISKPLPRIVDYIAWPIIHLQLLLSLSQVHLLVKVGTLRSVFSACDEVIRVVLYLNFIDYEYLAPVLTAISIVFVIALVIVYKNETFVVRPSATYTLRVFLHILCPIFTIFASSVLQQLIEDAVLNGKFDPLIIVMLIGFLVYIALGILSCVMFGQPLHPPSLKFLFWNFSVHSVYVVLACVLQQLWSLAVKYPKWGPYVVFALSAVGSIAGFVTALDLPYFSPVLNIFLMGMNMCFALSSILFCFFWRWSSLDFEFALAYLGIILLTMMVAPSIYSMVGGHILRDLHKGPRDEKFQDLSDDSSVGAEMPKLTARKSILLLHYLVIAGYPDLCEFTMRMAEVSEHMDVIVECFRVLVMLESVPAIVWTKVLEIERLDVAAWQRPILCELQYEAVKMIEPGEGYTDIYREFNSRKQAIVRAMVAISEASVDKDTNKLTAALDNYVELCEDMEFMAKVYITHAPKSLVLLESYYDYLAKLSGNFSEAVKYKMLIDSLRNGNLVTIAQGIQSITSSERLPALESGKVSAEITPQQLITQQVAKSIRSPALPRAIILFVITMIVWIVAFIVRPSYLAPNVRVFKGYVEDTMDFLGLVASIHIQQIQFHINQILICKTDLTTDVRKMFQDIKNMDKWYNVVTVAEFDAIIRDLADDRLENANLLGHWFLGNSGSPIESLSFMMRSLLQQYERLYYEQEQCYAPVVAEILHTNGTALSTGQSLLLDFLSVILHQYHLYLRKVVIIGVACMSGCIFISATALVLYCVLALKKEFTFFSEVFFKIDDESMNSFRDELSSRLNMNPDTHRPMAARTQELNQSDDNYLELEEIELEEDDPLTIPLDFRIDDPGDSADFSWKQPSGMSVKRIKGYSIAVVMLMILYVLACVALYMGNLHQQNSSYERVEQLFQEVESIRYLMSNGCNIGYSGLSSTTNVSPLVCSDINEYVDICQAVLEKQNTWNIPDCDAGLASALAVTMERIVPVIDGLLNEGVGIIDPMVFLHSVTWGTVSFLGALFTVILFTCTLLHFRHGRRWFDSVRSLLLLIPSRYFSTISTLAELFEFHGTKKTDRDRQVIASSILKHSREGIVYIDEGNRIVEAGQAALAVFAFKKEDLIGKDVQEILPGFKQLAAANADLDVVRFEIDGQAANGQSLKMFCTYIRGGFDTSILLLNDVTEILAIQQQISQCRVKLEGMLRPLMPDHLTARYLSGQYQMAIQKDQIVMGTISIVDFNISAARTKHEHLMEIIDLLYSTCDRKIGDYPLLSRIIMDNCMYRFVGGMFSDESIKEAVKQAFDFTTRVQLKCNTRMPHFVQRSVKVQGCLSIQKNVIGSIFSKELPLFDTWCPDEDDFRELLFGFTDERIVRVTEDVKNYLEEFGVECIQEMEGMFKCPTFIVHIEPNDA